MHIYAHQDLHDDCACSVLCVCVCMCVCVCVGGESDATM